MSFLWRLIKYRIYPPEDTHPSFKGRNVIITGANVGLGFEASLKFVQLGADRVILAVRSLAKGEAAQKEIESRTGREGCIEVWQLDMLDYESIKAFVKRAEAELDHLDIACLNAGVVFETFQQSAYGWEKTVQVNVLSTALLGLLLMPKLKAGKTADYTPVLELVSSDMHYMFNKLRSESSLLDAYNFPKGYSPESQYGVSKVFLEYAHAGLTKIANGENANGRPDVFVVSVCPGATRSDLGRDIQAWYLRAALWLFSVTLQRTTEQGSRTYISGVTLGEKGHGRFWQSDEIKE